MLGGGDRRQGAAQALDGFTGTDAAGLKWSKAPCRFCGTGCGVTVAVKDNRVVATHGDLKHEVNRGINCVKGYFLSKIVLALGGSIALDNREAGGRTVGLDAVVRIPLARDNR